MKYLPFFLFLILCAGVLFCGFYSDKNAVEYDYLRIHIRANSNSEKDQSVKYLIKDDVVNYITPYLVNCTTKQECVGVITALLDEVKMVCDDGLVRNGFTYKSRVRIGEEHFPTRAYDNVVLDAGVYDALIIELGEGVGDNWWCIVYPPLCFVNKSDLNEYNIQYQSYLVEIIRKYYKG